MNIAVVILNWNGKSLLENFLPSVIAHSNQASIYIADNASTDDSVTFISEKFSSVQIIKNNLNGGYAKGYNDAITHITEDILVLLNNDVEVTEGWLAPVLSEFKKEPKLVAAQPKILDYTKKSHFEYAGAAGGFLDALAYPFCRGRIFNTIEEDKGQYNTPTLIFWASGACLFVKRDAFNRVDGFDEDFFAHQEEIDLCWRLHVNGGIIKYFPDSIVYHQGGGTLNATNPKKTFYNFRNTLLLLVKNVSGASVWFKIFIRLCLDGLAAIQFLVQGRPLHLIAILRAHLSFYALLPKFLKKRKLHASKIRFASSKSIVYQYFIKLNKKFSDLN